ncbi:YHYH protein [Streptomyces sp. NPDC008343]|uniref:YHYH protein n=1 Tax=Streptomyces sp. NPDC008343 TaxID=3364828 RepID=UPI0036F0D58A
MGDGKIQQSGAKRGYAWSCKAGSSLNEGSHKDGPWIDSEANTWDSTAKLIVQGEHSWPQAEYSEKIDGDTRTIKASGLPTREVTGTFPIESSDPAYEYDRNPNSIEEHGIEYSLPLNPDVASSPSCLTGTAGILKNGVELYAGFDATDRDAVAHETQDVCDGHPDPTSHYHYHSIPSCLVESTKSGAATLVGYALDGFGIYVERDSKGNLPTNADLDECHGRTSSVEWNGKMTTIYHYVATLEFPYTVGCYRGSDVQRPAPGA